MPYPQKQLQELHFCRNWSARIASLHERDTFIHGVVADIAVQQGDVLRVGLDAASRTESADSGPWVIPGSERRR
jgi:hypothetical protein